MIFRLKPEQRDPTMPTRSVFCFLLSISIDRACYRPLTECGDNIPVNVGSVNAELLFDQGYEGGG